MFSDFYLPRHLSFDFLLHYHRHLHTCSSHHNLHPENDKLMNNDTTDLEAHR